MHIAKQNAGHFVPKLLAVLGMDELNALDARGSFFRWLRPWRQWWQTENFANRRKRPTMNRRGAKAVERQEMLTHGIALVLRKSVTRMLGIQSVHESIPRGFGEDGGSCNRQAFTVALHDRLLGYGHIFETSRIEEQMLRLLRQAFDGTPHGE